MKKTLFLLVISSFVMLSANASTWVASDRVPVVGEALLSKNGLPTLWLTELPLPSMPKFTITVGFTLASGKKSPTMMNIFAHCPTV